MTSLILELTSHLDLNPGASERAIDALLRETNMAFPEDYLEFLRFANGGESNYDREVGYESGLCRLYPVEEIIEITSDYFFDVPDMNDTCKKYDSPLLPPNQLPWMIGDTGADRGFCLDPRFSTPRFIAARLGCVEFYECCDLGTTFAEFLLALKDTGSNTWKRLGDIDRSLVKPECWPENSNEA